MGAGMSPQEVRTGFEGTQPENYGFGADYTSEAVSSQFDYYGAASRYVLILVRTKWSFCPALSNYIHTY